MRSFRVRWLVMVGLIVAAVGMTPTASYGDTFRVRALGDSPDNFRWKPRETHAPKGSRVRWKNRSTVTHHVKSYGGNWSYDKSIAPDEAVSKRFRRTGTFKFRCDIPGHSTLSGGTCSGMCGKVIVHN